MVILSSNYHRMQLPREVIVGKGILQQAPEIAKRLGHAESAFIIAGAKTYDIAGKTVRDLLEDKRIDVSNCLVETATAEEVEAVEEKIVEFKPQIVFGVGGGTKIDIAKCSSARRNIPFISVPTTASHDGIASPLSSIKGFEKPYSVMAQAPLAIIADTGVIMQEPWRFAVSGCGDVIAKLTAVRDWKLAHDEKNEYFGGYAASLALMSARLVLENAKLIRQNSEEGTRILVEALISCGVSMSIAGSSRPCSGSEHLFSHALEMVKPNHSLHGERCGVGAIMMAYLQGTNWKRVKASLEELGAPTTAKELNVEEDDIIEALVKAATLRPERFTILNKTNMTSEAYRKLCKATMVF